MAVVFDKTVGWLTQGNSRVKIRVYAETSGSNIIWKATTSGNAQTLCYGQKYKDYTSHSDYYIYYTYGNEPVYFYLEINGAKTGSKQAVGSIASGRTVSGKGWQTWGATGNTVQMTVSAPWTSYTVRLHTTGKGTDNNILIVSASVTPTPVTPTVTFLANAKTKVDGSWKSIASGKVKVDGTWKELTAGYVKIDGVWKQMT